MNEIDYIPISLVVLMWGAINEQTGFQLKDNTVWFSQGDFTVNANGFSGNFYANQIKDITEITDNLQLEPQDL